MVSSLSDKSFVLIASDNRIAHQLSYLFRVILRSQLTVQPHGLEQPEGAEPCRADMVILHANREAEEDERLITKIKSRVNPPVVIVIRSSGCLTSSGAFIAGADDVVKEPICLPEFAARAMRRLGIAPTAQAGLDKNVVWRTEAYIAEQAELTTAESHVMSLLYRRAGEIVSRDELSEAIDGRPWEYGDRKFDVHVAKLRKKLSDAFGAGLSVSTIRSSGYVLTVQETIRADSQ